MKPPLSSVPTPMAADFIDWRQTASERKCSA